MWSIIIIQLHMEVSTSKTNGYLCNCEQFNWITFLKLLRNKLNLEFFSQCNYHHISVIEKKYLFNWI